MGVLHLRDWLIWKRRAAACTGLLLRITCWVTAASALGRTLGPTFFALWGYFFTGRDEGPRCVSHAAHNRSAALPQHAADAAHAAILVSALAVDMGATMSGADRYEFSRERRHSAEFLLRTGSLISSKSMLERSEIIFF